MRGLSSFITDIRNCKSKEEEKLRINKELGNIRSKFKGQKPLSGYDKKKYVCKLVFMFLLGEKSDLGYMEAINLLSSNAFSEKQIGYLFISVILGKDHQFKTLIINTIKNDLSSSNQNFQNLALQFIANNANKIMSEMLEKEVLQILTSIDSSAYVKQTAALAMLKLFRVAPSLKSKQHTNNIVHLLLHYDLGLVTASASLIECLASEFPHQFNCSMKPSIMRLSSLVNRSSEDFRDYTYFSFPSPWLVVKLLKILQKYPAPSDIALRFRLKESLQLILDTVVTPIKNKKFEGLNVRYAMIFEAIQTIIQTNIDSLLFSRAVNILGNTLHHTEPNLRFITLDVMAQLSDSEEHNGIIKSYLESILNTLRTEWDISVKRRAVDLLYNLCDENNVTKITSEMINFIKEEENVKEEVVLKLATLAERFNTNLNWYIDTIFETLLACGSSSHDSIWYSLVKVIIDNHTIHKYAAKTAFKHLHSEACSENVVKASGYILGEFGYIIANDPDFCPLKQLNKLHEIYRKCSTSTRSLLLTTYMKFFNFYPELKEQIQSIFREHCNHRSENAEIQQRAVEYLKFSEIASKEVLIAVMDKMPAFQRQEPFYLKSQKKDGCDETLGKEPMVNSDGWNIITDQSMLKTERTVQYSSEEVSKNASLINVDQSTPIDQNILIKIDSEANSFKTTTLAPSAPSSQTFRFLQESSNEKFIHNLMFHSAGVLFEDAVIKVSVQHEFERQYGRLCVVYKNKSQKPFRNFTIEGVFECVEDKCRIWFKPNELEIPAGKCMMHDIHVECITEFTEKPSLVLGFQHEEDVFKIKLKLPLAINMFMEPCNMTPEMFLLRWNNLGPPHQEVEKTFTAKYPMMYDLIKIKLRGFKLSVLDNMTANSANIHCAGLFWSRRGKIGFLVILECYPKAEDHKYRLTVRSKQKNLALSVSNLISELL